MSNERRRAARQDMQWRGLIVDAAGAILGRCLMVNVSATGAKLLLAAAEDVPDSFVLILAKNGEVKRQCEVTWRAEKSIGVQFIRPAGHDELSHLDDALARISSRIG